MSRNTAKHTHHFGSFAFKFLRWFGNKHMPYSNVCDAGSDACLFMKPWRRIGSLGKYLLLFAAHMHASKWSPCLPHALISWYLLLCCMLVIRSHFAKVVSKDVALKSPDELKNNARVAFNFPAKGRSREHLEVATKYLMERVRKPRALRRILAHTTF